MATAGAPRRFCRCACFCSENLYVARYGLHVRFRGEQQLRRDYGPVSGLHWLCGERGGQAVRFARLLRSDSKEDMISGCLGFFTLSGDSSISLARRS